MNETAGKQEARHSAPQKWKRRIRRPEPPLIDVLSAIAEFRIPGAAGHMRRMREHTRVIIGGLRHRHAFSESQIKLISSASALHDVGNIALPDNVLLNRRRFSRGEFEIMKTHAARGAELVETLGIRRLHPEFHAYCRDICRCHHERHDGHGYPDGLKGAGIPIWAQAASIADVYDALRSERPYRPAFGHAQAVRMITGGRCGQFGPDILEAFLREAPKLNEIRERA